MIYWKLVTKAHKFQPFTVRNSIRLNTTGKAALKIESLFYETCQITNNTEHLKVNKARATTDMANPPADAIN